jgi:hypothetical protein
MWTAIGPRDEARRYREVAIAPEFLAALIAGGGENAYVIGVPTEVVEDLRIVAFDWRPEWGAIRLLVHSASFEPVHESELAPAWSPSYRAFTPEGAIAERDGLDHAAVVSAVRELQAVTA